MKHAFAATVLATALLCAPSAGRAQTAITPADASGCPAGAIDIGSLPHSTEAIAQSGEFTIVAFGSSSTQGWMSSDAGHSYPALMQEALEQSLPHAHVAVINRGIGGQDALEELSRIDADVTALHPSLVIWQVGANGAIRRTDPAVFRSLVESGLDRLQHTNVDIVLMDNQRSPLIMASPEHGRIDSTLADIARDRHVGMFARSALMDAWLKNGHGYDEFVSADGLHHNDHGYRCLGLAVAQSILKGLNAAQAPVMVSTVLPPTPPRAPAPTGK